MDNNPPNPTGQQKAGSRPRFSRLTRALRYGLAVAAVAVGLGSRQALTAWVGPGLATYITFYPPVMVAALLGGIGPGLLATALAGLAAAYWVLPPVGHFAITAPVDRLGLVIFTGMGLFMSVVAELYRRRRHKAAAYDREAVLRESQARVAVFAASTFEGIVESEAGRILDCNEQYARMLGYSVAELRGVEIASLAAPEDRDRVREIIRQGRESGIEHTALRKDGTRIVIEVRGRPVSPGSPRRHSAVRDVTERKRAESVQQATLQRFYDVLASMSSGVLLVAEEGRVEFANQAICDQFGLANAPASLVGLEAGVMIEKIKPAYLHPDEAVARIQEIVERGQRLTSEEVAMQGGRTCLRDYVPLNVQGKSCGRMWLHFDITARKRAEEEMSLLSGVVEAAANGIVITDRAGKILWVNPAFTKLTGYTAAEAVGQNPRVLKSGQHPPEFYRTIWETILRGEVWHGELVNKRKDGSLYSEEMTITPVRVAGEAISHFIAIKQDVTERKRVEAALQRERYLLRTLIDLIPDSVYVRDAQDRFLVANAKLARRVGVRSPEEMLGKTDADFYGPGASAALRADDQRVLAGETILNKEERIVSPADGERVVLTTKVPFKDSDGVVVGLVGVGRDITERKRAEAALRESETRYRTLFNTIDAGFCIVEMIFDAQGKPVDYRFLEINAAFERQTGLHDVEGKSMRELAPAHEAHWFEIYGKIALTGEARHFVNEARALDRWYDVYAYRVGAPENRHVAILFNDITAHKQAETELQRRAEELRAANEELTRFNRITVGRELRIIELKQQVNELCARLGQPLRYKPEPGEEARPVS